MRIKQTDVSETAAKGQGEGNTKIISNVSKTSHELVMKTHHHIRSTSFEKLFIFKYL